METGIKESTLLGFNYYNYFRMCVLAGIGRDASLLSLDEQPLLLEPVRNTAVRTKAQPTNNTQGNCTDICATWI